MSGSRTQNTEALYFHRIAGRGVHLQENSTVAERSGGGRCFNGLVYYHRPIKHQEEISFKILNFNPEWSINLGLGVTTQSPRSCSTSLLEEKFHELIKEDDWWGRGVPDEYLELGGSLTLKFNINLGTVDLRVNKNDNHEETIKSFVNFKRFLNHSDSRVDIWMFLYLRGYHIKVQLLPRPSNRNSHVRFKSNCLGASCLPVRDNSQSQNRPSRLSAVSDLCETNRTDDFNYMKWVQDCIKSYVPTAVVNFLQTAPSLITHPQTAPVAPTTTTTTTRRPSTSTSTRRRTETQTNVNAQEPVVSVPSNTNSNNSMRTRTSNVPVISNAGASSGNSVARIRTSKQSLQYPDVTPGSLQFHSSKGRSIYINYKGFKASRRNVSGVQKNGYLFISTPIEPGQSFVIRILSKDETMRNSLIFGMTSCDPSSLNVDELPTDPNLLGRRLLEYWVHTKNNRITPEVNVGDELCFTISKAGHMCVSRNKTPSEHLFYVNIVTPVWAWFNLVESVSGIYILGKRTVERNGSSQTRTRIRLRSVPQPESLPALSTYTMSPSSSTSTPLPVPSAPPLHLIDPPLPSFSTLNISPSSPPPEEEEVELAEEAQEELPIDSNPLFFPPPTDCVICMDQDVNSCVIPCGHLGMCYTCALKYWKSAADVGCPLCRKPITNIIQTFKA